MLMAWKAYTICDGCGKEAHKESEQREFYDIETRHPDSVLYADKLNLCVACYMETGLNKISERAKREREKS